VERTQPPQDGGLKAISKIIYSRHMMRSRARRKAKNFVRSVLLFIVCCVWVLFWFDVLTSITNDPGYLRTSPEQAFLRVTLSMLAMVVVPFGFVAARLCPDLLPEPRLLTHRHSPRLSDKDRERQRAAVLALNGKMTPSPEAMNREGEARTLVNALDQQIDSVRCERAAPLGRKKRSHYPRIAGAAPGGP
jgi:hypothetical protein